MIGIVVFVLLALTQIALGQDAAALPPPALMVSEKSFLETLLSGDFVAKLIPMIVGVQILLYGVAEGLTRISVITENKWDNKLANWLSEAAWVAGVLVGKFGYGTPKLVMEEKVAKKAEEQKSGG